MSTPAQLPTDLEKVYPGVAFGTLERGQAGYPDTFGTEKGRPERLYYIGDLDALEAPGLAIVGARKATEYGLSCTRMLARRAAELGFTVVSGGAIGCDQEAHRGALDAGARTIVVLGCGVDVVYPERAKPLFDDVLARGGLLISEFAWSTLPKSWTFIRRNSLIAGLGLATLIIEAGLPSGTFSTADATLEQGKELLAVPGSIFSKQSRGSNHLIAQGAYPVIDAAALESILLGIRESHGFGAQGRAAGEEGWDVVPIDPLGLGQEILNQLRSEARRPEELLAAVEKTITLEGGIVEVLCCLSHLELEGLVKRMRDGRFAYHAK
ncbi:MAG: DNA-processing protein DprA [Coriobacteriia bacterium]|nr:DNA-processing protein DprA [Coriobacteriia bacterium]